MHLRACREIGRFGPDLRYTSDDFTILLELVRTTEAGALLPDLVVAFDALGVVTRPFRCGGVGRQVLLLTRRSRTPTVEAATRTLRSMGKDASSHAPPPTSLRQQYVAKSPYGYRWHSAIGVAFPQDV